MSTNQTTADNTQHAGQHTGKLSTISNKVGGLGNIIRGTGEIIHGHIPGAGDSAHGGKAAIRTAGRQEVERGLDRIDGKPTNAFAAGGGNAPAQDWERNRVGDGNGAAPTTAPQASTAAPRADDLTSQKDRGPGVAADIRHHPDIRQQQQGNGTVTGGQDKLDQEFAATTSPSDHRDTDVHQQVQGNGEPATGTSDVRQQGNGFASSDRDKAHWQETRTTADTSDPVNTAVGQERRFGTAPQA